MGDLFDETDGSLAHCVAADFSMSAGIAVQFRERFGGVEQMKAQRPAVGAVVSLPRGETHRVYALVTKARSSDKPTYDDLRAALDNLAKDMARRGLYKVAFPKLACGLDGLDWNVVQRLIVEAFDSVPPPHGTHWQLTRVSPPQHAPDPHGAGRVRHIKKF